MAVLKAFTFMGIVLGRLKGLTLGRRAQALSCSSSSLVCPSRQVGPLSSPARARTRELMAPTNCPHKLWPQQLRCSFAREKAADVQNLPKNVDLSGLDLTDELHYNIPSAKPRSRVGIIMLMYTDSGFGWLNLHRLLCLVRIYNHSAAVAATLPGSRPEDVVEAAAVPEACICRRRPNSLESTSSAFSFFRLLAPSDPRRNLGFPFQIDPSPRSFLTGPANVQGPTSIDYRSLLQEDEFHRLADSTIHDLRERFEEHGDEIEIDGFDIDYGNDVLTLKLGDLGSYVINKQIPNRQIWLPSPVSGPSRFNWD